jgi:hypothetical protein
VRSAEGLLRRLDQLTCLGCHEARSIAGFHLLGEDPLPLPLPFAPPTSTVYTILAHTFRFTKARAHAVDTPANA